MSSPARIDQMPLVGVYDPPDDGHDDDSAVFGRMRRRVPHDRQRGDAGHADRGLSEVQVRPAARKLPR